MLKHRATLLYCSSGVDKLTDPAVPYRWREITTKTDAEALVNAFSGFHDSILREAHWINNAYASQQGVTFSPEHPPAFRLLIQGLDQQKEAFSLELVFLNVQAVRFDQDQFDVIDAATLIKNDSGVYWAPEHTPDDENPARFCVHGLRAFWRFGQLLGSGWHYWNMSRPSFFDDVLFSDTGPAE